MNHRRYDEIVSLLASISFGLLLQDACNLVNKLDALIEKVEPASDLFLPWLVFAGAMAVNYRAIHGLISYDRWSECNHYQPAFEMTPFKAGLNLALSVLAALLLPYLPFFLLNLQDDANHGGNFWYLIIHLLYTPLLCYIAWNSYWLSRLVQVPPPRMRALAASDGASDTNYLAYDEITRFTRKWVILDAIWVVSLLAFVSLYCIYSGRTILWFLTQPTPMLWLYSVISLGVVVADFSWNRKFYFPTDIPQSSSLIRAERELSGYPDIWDRILPDGREHCHWGGRAETEALVKRLGVRKTDRVLDICCGCGGTLRLIVTQGCKLAVGLDNSKAAIAYCRGKNWAKDVEFVESSVSEINEGYFADKAGFFTKIIAVDADAWLDPRKIELLVRVRRLLAPQGIFVFQSYMSSSSMPFYIRRKTAALMSSMGYKNTQTLDVETAQALWEKAGFSILHSESKHSVYLEDNLRMLQRIRGKSSDRLCRIGGSAQYSKIKELLTWEKLLFKRKYWTGTLLVATPIAGA